MNSEPPTRRRYDVSHRQRQAEQTREIILAATADLITEQGLQALSVPEVARRAGVSLRTVWRNFPSHEALMEGLDASVSSMSPFEFGNVDEYPAYLRRQYAWLDDIATLILPTLYWRFSRNDAPPGRAARLRAASEALATITSNLSPEVARRGRVAIALLPNAMSWAVLRKDLGLSGAESGEAAAWILGLVLDELKRLNLEAIEGADDATPGNASSGHIAESARGEGMPEQPS